MTLSIRMEPLLEHELERAAKHRGMTKTQFVIDAVEHALGLRNPHELMLRLQAEEAQQNDARLTQAFDGREQPYAADTAREFIKNRLLNKDDASNVG